MVSSTLRKLAGFLATLLLVGVLVHVLLAGGSSSNPIAGNALSWLGAMALGDFGITARDGTPVGHLIAARLTVTLPLIALSLAMAVVLGAILGGLAAWRPKQWLDHALSALGEVGLEASYQALGEPTLGTHTLSSGVDTRLIDYVYYLPRTSLTPQAQRVMRGRASDHRPLVVDFDVTVSRRLSAGSTDPGGTSGSTG